MSKLSNVWIHGDCMKELQKLTSESVDMVMTSPPYHNLRVYSNDPADISNCESYEEYYYLLGNVIEECNRVLKPGGKFVIQFEDYNYTLGRDGKRGKESIVGGINDLFLEKGFNLHTECIWEKYTPQRAMISDGQLWFRNGKNKDVQLAANWGYVFTYRKAGETEKAIGMDLTLEDWSSWASGVWKINNSGISHTTPFAEELVKRCVKLWSYPNDTILDPFAGCGTVNKVAIENGRNVIGIELNEKFYKDAIELRFNKWDESIFEVKDSVEKMTERFIAEKLKSEEGKEEKAKEKEESKQLTDKKKNLKDEIKLLEVQLNILGLKKSEIEKIKKSQVSLEGFND